MNEFYALDRLGWIQKAGECTVENLFTVIWLSNKSILLLSRLGM